MCSTCGGRAAARLAPGAIPSNPIMFGEPDGRPAQPATILVETSTVVRGKHVYVAGAGVEKAIVDGLLSLGYNPVPAPESNPTPRLVQNAPEFYVKIGRNKWVGFKSRLAAERYARSVDSAVVTRGDVLKLEGE